MNVKPVVLEGRHVRLEPLSLDHLDCLAEFGLDERLWQWTPHQCRTRNELQDYIEQALALQTSGSALPFATIEKTFGKPIGSTRFGSIDVENRRAEIGWTWIAPSWQRTVVNTEAKYLMFTHAFENWRCTRVELKTDALNEQSRKAILRIGATEEGTLRKHVLTYTGRFRDTVYYSILDTEWPPVRKKLEARLEQ